MPGGPYRTHLARELAGLAAGSRVRLAGRILARRPNALVLLDASGPTSLPLAQAMGDLAPGDLVLLDATVAPGATGDEEGQARRLEEATITILARRRGAGEYPLPGCEIVRLDGSGQRRRNLVARDAALRAIRAFFHARGFCEIEAPLVVPSPGLEVHLDALATVDGRFLITSPEYQLKRLLVAGLERIFAIARCVRRGERGLHHNSEFTMLEWYRAFSDYEEVMADVEALVPAVARAVRSALGVAPANGGAEGAEGATPWDAPWERLTVREAMQRYAGVDLAGDESVAELRRKLEAADLPLAPARPGEAWDELFFQTFLTKVEPRLGERRPAILCEWPLPLAALARKKKGDPRVVERFEVYAGGLELANAFGELCDPDEQRARFRADLAERARRDLPLYPIDERFLAALDEGMAPSAGIALGVDRLLMLCAGARDLRDVTAFTDDEL